MKPRHLLYLTDQQMAAYRWEGGHLTSEGIFAHSVTGLQQFTAYLSARPNEVFRFLANVADESFLAETIPALRHRNRRIVIDRKLSQLFKHAPLRASAPLAQVEGAHKKERLLFASLGPDALFSPWLNALATTGTALSGIYSLPFLAPALLKRLNIPYRHCLLLTQHGEHLRQSYLDGGHLHFSRLSPLPVGNDAIAQAFPRAAEEITLYLRSQRVLDRSQPVLAHLIGRADLLPSLRLSCIDSDALRFILHNSSDCAMSAKIKSPQETSGEESMFLHLAASTSPDVQFADGRLRHSFHLMRLRRALIRTGGCACLCGLGAALMLFANAHAIRQEADALRHATARIQAQTHAITEGFPRLPVDRRNVRRVVDRFVDLERQSLTPTPLYHAISRALQEEPAIELDSIDWTSTDKDGESAIINAFVSLAPGATPRKILRVFDHFVSALSAQPTLQINIQKRPFDIESGKTLRNEDARLDDPQPRPFSLRIFRRVAP